MKETSHHNRIRLRDPFPTHTHTYTHTHTHTHTEKHTEGGVKRNNQKTASGATAARLVDEPTTRWRDGRGKQRGREKIEPESERVRERVRELKLELRVRKRLENGSSCQSGWVGGEEGGGGVKQRMN